MKAVGYIESLPPADTQSLFDFEADAPVPSPRDLLVSVRAVSVNPIDCKVRMRAQGTSEKPKVLGFDCAGVVVAIGSEVSLFKAGDEVFYAGSILRLARRLTGLTVLASASRPETREWVLDRGAHYAVDHSKKLSEEVRELGFSNVEYIISLNQTGQHFDEIVELIAPQGSFALIDDPTRIDVTRLKAKSASLHWESMFTRSSFETADMIEQHRILCQVSKLLEDGLLRTTLSHVAGAINAQNLRSAHGTIESGRSIGKIVLEGF
jgi:NADPH:quinone reductase-like Zn-dependent oxidoreductase